MKALDIHAGWTRHALTWCRVVGSVKLEVSRYLNQESGLIEWHTVAWTDTRSDPIVSEFVGQDWHAASELAMEAAQ